MRVTAKNLEEALRLYVENYDIMRTYGHCRTSELVKLAIIEIFRIEEVETDEVRLIRKALNNLLETGYAEDDLADKHRKNEG